MYCVNYWQLFIAGIKATTAIEFIAVCTGIISVWYSKKENILVYPIGLISTTIYIYLSFKNSLIGEAAVNFYYTIMSIVGWYLWLQKKPINNDAIIKITYSTKKELIFQGGFFLTIFLLFYMLLLYLQKHFYPGVIPWADAFATASAFTGMYLMIKKKIESWYWWITTNIGSIPLYCVKGLLVTSIYYCILLVLAIYGLKEWKQKVR